VPPNHPFFKLGFSSIILIYFGDSPLWNVSMD